MRFSQAGIDIGEWTCPRAGFGLDLFLAVASNPGRYRIESFTDQEAEQFEVFSEDGGEYPGRAIGDLWAGATQQGILVAGSHRSLLIRN